MPDNAAPIISSSINRSDDSDNDVDVRVRFPYDVRNLAPLNQLRIV